MVGNLLVVRFYFHVEPTIVVVSKCWFFHKDCIIRGGREKGVIPNKLLLVCQPSPWLLACLFNGFVCFLFVDGLL